jgi:hypothetical protein
MKAEVTGKYGPLSATLGAEMDLDCFNTKGYFKGGAFGQNIISADTNGKVKWPGVKYGGKEFKDYNPGKFLQKSWKGERTDSGSWGVKAQGKVSWKQCGSW